MLLLSLSLFEISTIISVVFLVPHFPRPRAPARHGQPEVLWVPVGEAEKGCSGWTSKKGGTREKRRNWEEEKAQKEAHLSADPWEEEVRDALPRGGHQNGERERKRYTNTQFLFYKNTPWFQLICFLLSFSLTQTPRRESRLFCRYYDNHHNPHFVLSPVKQQDEWDRPYIVRYIDIISDSEIERVKQLAKPRVRDPK